MATYAIGDVQGCYSELMHLLDKIKFSETADTLWFTGDLVNRGSESLKVLHFVKNLPHAITVLGNHDLHLLALYYLKQPQNKSDTLTDILQASDCDELCHWLSQRPFLHYDKKLDYTLTHAGIYPDWDLTKAQMLAHEIETALQHGDKINLFNNMYGNEPSKWSDDLTGVDRLRFIINAFTRMRFVTDNNALELNYKGTIKDAPSHLIPWFQSAKRKTKSIPIIFGHWAALSGETLGVKNIYPLDTGCVWGNQLTCLCLENQTMIHFTSKSIP